MSKISIIPAIIGAIMALCSLSVRATVIVSASTGDPLPKSSVFDQKGNMIGLGNEDGSLPEIPVTSYPVTVRYVGFIPETIRNASVERVEMQELDYDLPEITVDSESHNIVHLLGYLREYSTMTDSKDTILLFSEKIVDYMVPDKKVKKFKGWKSPRILAHRNYYRFTNSDGLDSVSNHCENEFSWLELMDIIAKKIKIPEQIKNEEVNCDTVRGKHGDLMVWRKSGDNYFLEFDMLADKKDHKWSPSFLKLFGLTTDFSKLGSTYTFSDLQGDEVSTENVTQASFGIEALCKGKVFRWATGRKEPFNLKSYYEFYVTDREFLTVEDANEWKVCPNTKNISINPPEGIPDLEPAIIELQKRVNNDN